MKESIEQTIKRRISNERREVVAALREIAAAAGREAARLEISADAILEPARINHACDAAARAGVRLTVLADLRREMETGISDRTTFAYYQEAVKEAESRVAASKDEGAIYWIEKHVGDYGRKGGDIPARGIYRVVRDDDGNGVPDGPWAAVAKVARPSVGGATA